MSINYYPLGSVVLLKGGIRKLIIVARGVNARNGNNEEFFFDYGGVSYPEGIVGNQIAYFNHESVDTVVFEGYSDAEDKHMVKNINSYLEKHPNILKGSPENWK